MAEPADAVVPILRNIQKELSDFRRNAEAKLSEQGEKLDRIGARMTYHMGVTLEQEHEIETLRTDVADLKSRVAALEGRS